MDVLPANRYLFVFVQKTNRMVFLESRRVFEKTTVYKPIQFQVNKKEITKFAVDFKNFFGVSNLSQMMTIS